MIFAPPTRAAIMAIAMAFAFWTAINNVCRAEEPPRSASLRALQGKWEAFSASYKTTGGMWCAFEGEVLTIRAEFRDEPRLDAPVQTHVSRWRIEIDETRQPHRLIRRRIAEPGEAEGNGGVAIVEAFIFRDGELWMIRDFGDDRPLTEDSFKPGGAGSGWLTGYRRVED